MSHQPGVDIHEAKRRSGLNWYKSILDYQAELPAGYILRPAFEDPYAATPVPTRTALADVMFTMRPNPCSAIRGATARIILNVPVRLTLSTAAQSVSLIFAIERSRVIPALLTRRVGAFENSAIAVRTALLSAISIRIN